MLFIFGLSLVWMPLCQCMSSADLLIVGAAGKDITNEVIDRMQANGLLPNHKTFFQTLASVQSDYGVPFVSENGGIWRINERMLKRIQEACKKALSSTCDLYKEIFHYDISSATINDMDKPLYSGLMIFLYILSLDEPIPENRREQAIYWRKHVNLDGKLGDYLTHSDQILGFENIETPCSGNLVNSSGPPYCKMPNVCSRSAIEKEDIYFPYTDPRIFVKCLDTYKYYIMSCPPDFVWSQTTDACIPQNAGNDNKAYQYSRTTGGSTAIVNSMQLILISFSIYLIELYL
ncbi:uncharacterized protein LOC118763092 [Octopus sinensis]|uniref:Uncharacterized protein LOC118763092 n=1 Tax=Octopus sinensis TaxID=2607531 RepID=A0A7E6EU67_9MOLL|nr:uncharacterized protein LOC118763092 [Octopus sinensis]